MEVKDILLNLREKNHLTQEQMAERIGDQTGCKPLGDWHDATQSGVAQGLVPRIRSINQHAAGLATDALLSVLRNAVVG